MGGISEIVDQVKLLILSIYTEIFPVAQVITCHNLALENLKK